MRNNPKHGTTLEYTDNFIKYSRIEKIRRFFNAKKQKINKHWTVKYQNGFTKRDIPEYIQALDGFLQMNGKLIKTFGAIVMDLYKDYDLPDVCTFEDLYDHLKNWAVSEKNVDLDYDDFAAADEQPKPNSMDAFKKGLDRI